MLLGAHQRGAAEGVAGGERRAPPMAATAAATSAVSQWR